MIHPPTSRCGLRHAHERTHNTHRLRTAILGRVIAYWEAPSPLLSFVIHGMSGCAG